MFHITIAAELPLMRKLSGGFRNIFRGVTIMDGDFEAACRNAKKGDFVINELYGNNGYRLEVVSVKRMINSDASNRVGEEVIICNC